MRLACVVLMLAGIGPAVAATAVAGDSEADPVVARQGGVEVTLYEIRARLEEVPAGDRLGYLQNPDRVEQLVRSLALAKQLAARARSEGLDKGPLHEALMRNAETQLLASGYVQHFGAEHPTPDMRALAQERYLSDPAKFQQPAEEDVRYLTLSLIGKDEASQRALGESIRRQVLDGADFQQLIDAHSDEPGKDGRPKGFYKSMRPGDAAPLFQETVAKMTVGQLGEVIKIGANLYLIRLEARRPAVHRSFDDVRDQLIAELETKARQDALDTMLDELRSNSMELDREAFGKLEALLQEPAP